MFEIIEGNVNLVHMNIRLEKRGDESVQACDLSFLWETNNGALAMFAPELRHCLYKAADGAQLELATDPDHLTALRFPHMGPIKWTGGELIGGELNFHYGVKSEIAVEIKKLHKFRLECKEGGTVAIGFQVQCLPTEQQIGKFSMFLAAGTCTLSVTPPAAKADDDQP